MSVLDDKAGLLEDSEDFQDDGEEAGGEDRKENFFALTRVEVEKLLSSGKDLSGRDMRKANLAKLDLSGCNLQKANLSYAVLKDSKLVKADLKEASLWNANLEGANLTEANLENSDLDYAKLRGAVLYKANIRRAHLPVDLVPREDIIRSVEEGVPVSKK